MKAIILTTRKDVKVNINSKLEFEFFKGYTPDSLEFKEKISNLSFISSKKIQKKVLSDGERCCSYGHYKIWEKISSDQSIENYCLVLEDDYILNDDIYDVLDYIIKQDYIDFDFLILGRSKVKVDQQMKYDKVNPIINILLKYKDYSVGNRHRETTVGTVGYLVKKSDKLNSFLYENEIALADDWAFYKNRGAKILHASPMLVYENFEIPSTIEHARKNVVGLKKFLPSFFGYYYNIFKMFLIRRK